MTQWQHFTRGTQQLYTIGFIALVVQLPVQLPSVQAQKKAGPGRTVGLTTGGDKQRWRLPAAAGNVRNAHDIQVLTPLLHHAHRCRVAQVAKNEDMNETAVLQSFLHSDRILWKNYTSTSSVLPSAIANAFADATFDTCRLSCELSSFTMLCIAFQFQFDGRVALCSQLVVPRGNMSARCRTVRNSWAGPNEEAIVEDPERFLEGRCRAIDSCFADAPVRCNDSEAARVSGRICPLSLGPRRRTRLFLVNCPGQNVGDIFSQPTHFFSVLRGSLVSRLGVSYNATKEIDQLCLTRADVVIIGGGGLLHHNSLWTHNLLAFCRAATCVLWATGFNRHNDDPLADVEASGFDRNFQSAEAELLHRSHAARLRDYSLPMQAKSETLAYRRMLDASCLLPYFDIARRSCTITREIGFYLHQDTRRDSIVRSLAKIGSARVMFNDEKSVDAVLHFLCSSRVVITGSCVSIADRARACAVRIRAYSVWPRSSLPNKQKATPTRVWLFKFVWQASLFTSL